MENDSVRTSGESTLVDIWIDGKMRSISLSRQAIAAFLNLSPDRVASLTEDDRREFVRTNLSAVVSAAKERLGEDAGATTIRIEAGPFARKARGEGANRRQGDRRRGDRRKQDRGPPASGERRR